MKRKKRILKYSIVSILAFGMMSCEIKRPDTVLSDAEMEEVLYDYHIAKSTGEELARSENVKKALYIEYVFQKHGITEAEFDSSMVWFARNPKILGEIYGRVTQRLKAEQSQVNQLIALRDNKPVQSAEGDSIDVWAWKRIYHLSTYPLSNKLTFTLPSDVNFKDSDTLKWTVRYRFLNGRPANLAASQMSLQILYDKDTLNSMLRIDTMGVKEMVLSSDTSGALKEIRGFIYYSAETEEAPALLLDHISLMRYHVKDKK